MLLPAPLTPVTRQRTPRGNEAVRFCRLLPRAPVSLTQPCSVGAARVAAEATTAGEPIAGAAIGELLDVLRRAVENDAAAVVACAGADLDDFVGAANDRFFVLDDDDRVAAVAEALDRRGERLDVGRVEADRGFVEDVEHVDEAGAERGGEGDALRFAAAERAEGPVERDVADADVDEEGESGADVVHERAGDRLLPRRQVRLR